jgi:hypothetical protein
MKSGSQVVVAAGDGGAGRRKQTRFQRVGDPPVLTPVVDLREVLQQRRQSCGAKTDSSAMDIGGSSDSAAWKHTAGVNLKSFLNPTAAPVRWG